MGKTKRKKRTIARICSMIGVSLLILVILICIPLTLPRLTGFDIYTVVTGSMEPAIPVGSLIYVREEAPAELMEGEVVAYRCGNYHYPSCGEESGGVRSADYQRRCK